MKPKELCYLRTRKKELNSPEKEKNSDLTSPPSTKESSKTSMAVMKAPGTNFQPKWNN